MSVNFWVVAKSFYDRVSTHTAHEQFWRKRIGAIMVQRQLSSKIAVCSPELADFLHTSPSEACISPGKAFSHDAGDVHAKRCTPMRETWAPSHSRDIPPSDRLRAGHSSRRTLYVPYIFCGPEARKLMCSRRREGHMRKTPSGIPRCRCRGKYSSSFGECRAETS